MMYGVNIHSYNLLLNMYADILLTISRPDSSTQEVLNLDLLGSPPLS